jgi:hypothetical protein
MPTEDSGSVTRVYCPYCDRPYLGSSKKTAEKRALIHVRGQHPEMDNPFESDEN